ncbi:hypothetical protein DFR42_1011103 [Undibacterium pigrum]|uniref:Uncharacterized protein n=1 Tax=Undibacterium pigrum TaxID=401470 RepID=A0A318JT11_9BURK|nr:hypothetical protein DFR42_1011103 [Undibacterium pigrum]
MTVGPGITPDLLTLQTAANLLQPFLLQALAGLFSVLPKQYYEFTAGGELHPALKTYNLPTYSAIELYAKIKLLLEHAV